MEDYYDVLRLPYNASHDEIKAAFKRLTKKYKDHDDIIRKINKAYYVLSDKERKLKYDNDNNFNNSIIHNNFDIIPNNFDIIHNNFDMIRKNMFNLFKPFNFNDLKDLKNIKESQVYTSSYINNNNNYHRKQSLSKNGVNIFSRDVTNGNGTITYRDKNNNIITKHYK